MNRNLEKVAEQAAVMMRHSYDQPFSSRQLADLLGYRPKQILRAFQRQKGMKLEDFISRARVQRAKQYLRQNSQAPLHTIATALGYAQYDIFEKEFQELEHRTPEQFRQELLLEAATGYVRAHVREPAWKVAEELRTINPGIDRTIKNKLDMTVHQFILDQKIEEVQYAILCGTSPLRAVDEVRVGDYQEFSAAFRLTTGFRVRKYREEEDDVFKMELYFRRRFEDPLKEVVADMAKCFGKSRAYLVQKFFDETGMGVQAYLRQLKVEAAKRALLNPMTTVREASEWLHLGKSNLVRAFRMVEGVTLQEYREQQSIETASMERVRLLRRYLEDHVAASHFGLVQQGKELPGVGSVTAKVKLAFKRAFGLDTEQYHLLCRAQLAREIIEQNPQREDILSYAAGRVGYRRGKLARVQRLGELFERFFGIGIHGFVAQCRSDGTFVGRIDAIIDAEYQTITPRKVYAHFPEYCPTYVAERYAREKGIPLQAKIPMVKVEKAKELLDKHPGQKLSDLAEAVGYSRNLVQFSHHFRQVHGMTPREYQNQRHGPTKRAQKVKQWIGYHYTESDISLQIIAEAAGTSTTELCNTFPSICNGMTVFQYIRQLRARRAKRGLRNGLAVEQVARDVGYVDVESFREMFRGMVGKNPSQYSSAYRARVPSSA